MTVDTLEEVRPIQDIKLLNSVPEAADQLRLSERHVWRLVKEGRIEMVREGRRVLIPGVSLEAYIEVLRATARVTDLDLTDAST